MDRNCISFSIDEVLKWEQEGVPRKWDPFWNVKSVFTAGGMDGGGSPIKSPLSLPESVVLRVMPMGCPRHSDFGKLLDPVVSDRMWTFWLRENDIVTGRYINEVGKAIEELLERSNPKPKVIFIVQTCIDLLLGTDYTGIIKRLEERYHIRIGISQMEPMVNGKLAQDEGFFKKAMYGCLRGEYSKEKENAVNIVGRETVPSEEGDLVQLLKSAGVQKINYWQKYKTMEEADEMCYAKLNIAMEFTSLPTVKMMEKKWGIPYVYLKNSYLPDKIHENYQKLGEALGVTIDDSVYYDSIIKKIEDVRKMCVDNTFVIGENVDTRASKGASELMKLGFDVRAFFSKIILKEDYKYIKEIYKINPEVKIYSSSHPSVYYYMKQPEEFDYAVGLVQELYEHNKNTIGIKAPERFSEYRALERILKQIEESKQEKKETKKSSNIENESYKQFKNWGMFRSHEEFK